MMCVETNPLNNPKALEQMQKRTRSLLEELDDLYIERDRRLLIENRAATLIANAIRLLEQIDTEFPADQAENLQRKLLNAIRTRDSGKFARSVRRTNADT
jgi:hypothetical protein